MSAVLALVVLGSISALRGQEIRAQETITVERILIDAHVIDRKGNTIDGLRPSDFIARVDGVVADIESVEWIDTTQPYPEGLPPREAEEVGAPAVPQGRLIVMFFQTDFQRARVKGQIRMIHYALDFLDTLTPNDRVAVVSFDSHLKLREDFTNDRRRLEEAIRSSIKIDEPPPWKIVPSPALGSRLKAEDAKEAYSSEKALFLIGNALIPIPGSKTLLLLGWGLGRFTSSGVVMTRDYGPAQRALEASRTSVFTLDISDADYHSLEEGLKVVSENTGGFYMKTHLFPQLAMDKLQRTISGHYVLVLRRPPGPRGLHKIDVQLRRGVNGTVLARSTYQDK